MYLFSFHSSLWRSLLCPEWGHLVSWLAGLLQRLSQLWMGHRGWTRALYQDHIRKVLHTHLSKILKLVSNTKLNALQISYADVLLLRFQTELNCDFLEIHDGSNLLSPLISSFNGTQVPQFLFSSSNHLYMLFTTDNSRSNSGFKILYESKNTASLTWILNDLLLKLCPLLEWGFHDLVSNIIELVYLNEEYWLMLSHWLGILTSM